MRVLSSGAFSLTRRTAHVRLGPTQADPPSALRGLPIESIRGSAVGGSPFLFPTRKTENGRDGFHGVWRTIVEDYRAVRRNDPAIPGGLRGSLETLLCTPGFQALLVHRLVHPLHVSLKVPVLPRLLSLVARWWTGIEIHPGARIAPGVFIDHGSGVVVGESAVVGRGCVLFQGVTLGATGNERTWQRHPILEEGVFVGSGARVLGPVTLGKGARIGANAVVLEDVPPDTTMVGPKARAVKVGRARIGNLPEGVCRQGMEDLTARMESLEREVQSLRRQLEAARGLEERGMEATG